MKQTRKRIVTIDKGVVGMKYSKKAVLAGLVLCCMPMMTACSFKETLEVLWNGEDKQQEEDKSPEVSLEAANIDENVEKPTLNNELGEPVTYGLGGQADALTIEAVVNDGGTLSYQWYRNNVDINGGGTAIDGAVENSFVPPTSEPGTTYYYVVVTNTVGKGIQMATSTTKCVTVTEEPAIEEIAPEEASPEEAAPQAQTVPTAEAAADAEGSWVQNEGGIWFVYPDGTNAVSKWEHIGGQWYAFDENGYQRKGWYQEGDKVYYLDENGVMLHDTDVEGFHLGPDGVRQ